MDPNPTSPTSDALLARIGSALRDLRYGSVEIVVHEGRVVQLERRERLRLTPPSPRRGGSSSSTAD